MYTGKSKCLKCGHVFEDESIFDGCPFCKTDSFVSNITPIYELPKTNGTMEEFNHIFSGKGIQKYLPVLPFGSDTNLITLNEGNTPLTYLNSISNDLNIKLYAKDETRNPTWGHKDRLNAILINKALEHKAPGVIYASTGNNGASGAAYAAKAGMPCIVLTVKGVNKTLETFMQAYGACVIGVKTTSERWNILKECVDKFGWYPATNYTVPIVGSNPWAIEGYKIIAYELFLEMEELPDKIVVPICFGDALFGINKGFEELKNMGFIEKLPQMVAVEDYGPVHNAVKENSKIINPTESWGSIASSMSTVYGTYHSLYTVRNYNGLTAVMNNNEQISSAQLELAQKEGLYCESASATTLVGVKNLLASGQIKRGEKVVMLITASGVKDTAITSKYVGEVPECEATMEEFGKLLQNKYGVSL
ncbi:threonine synthase [Bacillus altitudinis]|uniref:threonine synthase n=1 Tax=Bacillus altitudinis TaxID=293387 RepID=UPI003D065685